MRSEKSVGYNKETQQFFRQVHENRGELRLGCTIDCEKKMAMMAFYEKLAWSLRHAWCH